MDMRFILLIIAVLVIFVSMGKNPFEAPEGYVPPDEFKDGIRARIEADQGMGGAMSGGAFNPNYSNGMNNSSMGSLVTNPAGPPGSSPSTNAYGGPSMQQQQGLPAISQSQNITTTVQPPAPPQGLNPFTGQPSTTTNYADPNAQPYQAPAQQPSNPSPFQSLPTPGSMLIIPDYIPRLHDETGRIVTFAGTKVYTADSQGRAMLMNDGAYKLSNGRTIIVKDGKRWWPVDANKL